MTCWSCNRELAGHWSACPACGALSLANVEAVARGVASMAVAFEFFDCPQGNGETLIEARIVDEGWTAVHPTRHGAALAAFDAAWSEGRERLASDAITGWAAAYDPGTSPQPMCRCVMVTDWTPGDIAEKLMLGPWPPRRHGKTAAMRKHAAEWEAKGGEVAWIDPEPSPQVRRLRELTNKAARNLMAGFGASSPDVDAERYTLHEEPDKDATIAALRERVAELEGKSEALAASLAKARAAIDASITCGGNYGVRLEIDGIAIEDATIAALRERVAELEGKDAGRFLHETGDSHD